jgi:hypothetical protein
MADAAAVAQFEPGEKIYAGQSVGLLDRVRPAGEIVKEIATQASALLSRASLSL